MFELPYLEMCGDAFERKFKKRVLQRLEIQQKKCINVSLAELNESVIGNELKSVWREGLSLYFQFRNYAVLEMRLSASAELLVMDQNQEATSGLLNLYFSGGQILSVKDGKILSKFLLNPVHVISPDVFSKEMTFEYLMGLLSNRKEEIKLVLMKQDLIRGIGEAYADEILWYAEISPFSIANRIPQDRVKVLYKTIKYVLLDAIKQTKKINALKFNEVGSDLLLIHNVNKKTSPTGKPIKVSKLNRITTFYTDEQMLYV